MEAWDEGLRLFDEGLYWECHEALEAIWLVAPPGEPPASPRLCTQALIQAAAGMHHASRTGRWAGAGRLLQAAARKLEAYPASYLGLDLTALAAGFAALGEQAARIARGEAAPSSFQRLAPPRLRPRLATRPGDTGSSEPPPTALRTPV
ncbi:MAG: DUF309 domain-containing protein [Planctomycetes bacterium]|nr:DUF309 domain-containing protein [Planctomycetota bacterium]